MKPFVLLIVLMLPQVFAGGSARQEGRRGNAHYEATRFEDAATAYRAGLAASERPERPDAVFYGLHNNLGAALYRQNNFGEAAEALGRAVEAAVTPADVARSAYNAGNAAFRQQQLEEALTRYRQALLADPADAKAKYNYEFVKRRLEEQEQEQQQQQEGDNQEQDQEQNQDEQGGEDQQNPEEQDGDDQQNQNQQQENQDEQQQQQPQPSPDKLSRQQAERILQALENEEEQLLREVQKVKGRPRRVEKDW